MIGVALASLLQAGAPAADPLEPAWRGQVQCYGPNVARRTCASIGSYAKDAKGVIQNKAVVLLSASPVVVMTSVSPVRVKGAAVCGEIELSDLKAATFVVDGAAAGPELAETVRRTIEPEYAGIAGREVCTIYTPDGDALKAEVSVAGKRHPEFDLPVRWVDANAGYEVKP